jgi:hypothetical protein
LNNEADFIGVSSCLAMPLIAHMQCERFFDRGSAAGSYLGRLAKNDANRVQKRGTGSGNRWVIQPPRNEAKETLNKN